MNKDYFGITDSLVKAVEEATKSHTIPKTEKDKKLANLAHPKDKITHKDVMVGRGVVAKEEVEQIEEVSSYTKVGKLVRKFIPGQGQKQAGERAKDQKYSAGLDRAALKYHPDDKKLATTMKSSEKAQKRYERISRGEAPFKSSPNDTRVKEEVEHIEELSKATLASYAKKAVSDARFKQGIGKDYEALGKRKRDPATKASFARMGLKVRMKAKSREEGAAKAIDRLAKEEVELDEISDIAHAKYRLAARADIKTQSKNLDVDNKAGDRIQKRVEGLTRSTGLEKVKKMTDDVPFTPDQNKKPIAKAGKYGIGYSSAKHLAKQGLKSVMTKEENLFKDDEIERIEAIANSFDSKEEVAND